VETVAAVSLVAAATAAVWDWHIMPRARRERRAPAHTSVTAIVPARNEAHNIGEWVHDVLHQTHRPVSVIVADDCSDDATATVAQNAACSDPRVTILSLAPPPPGWVGKNWAAYAAAALARSEWLFFSDADVRMAPQALSAALAMAAERGAGALSFSATIVCQTWLERQVMPAMAALIFSGMPASLVNDDRVPIGLLAGGFMLVRREAYERVGGHRAVRSSIAEDRDLAERLKAFGYRICLADGARLVRVRMYRSAREMWEGWRKNFYEGARRQLMLSAVFVAACLCMLVLPIPLLAALAIVRLSHPLDHVERRLAFVCAICIAATAAIRAARDRAIGFNTNVMSVVLTPVGGIFAAAVMAASAWRIETGQGQLWKDRLIR
jgi:GT2 family glycosyltransferase